MPGLLPRDVPGFTGREHELEYLTSQARAGSVVVMAISGIPGVGKTALAVHAAHQLALRFPDGQLYADLHGYTEGQVPAEPGEVLEEFLRSLGVASDELPVSMEERSGMLRQQLAVRRVLMILDNAASESQVRPLLPGAGASLVVITSRDALAGLEVDQRIDLGVLPDDQAAALLTRLIGQQRADAEPDALQQVCDLCGCLPLALRIAGQLLEVHKTWPVARLAGMLADVQHRLDYLSVGDRQVRAAFMVSYQQLPAADARLFRLLGLHPGPDFDVLAAASLAGIEAPETEQVLARLARVHLITEERPGRYGMHDLLRLFARETCFQTEDQEALGVAMSRLVRHFSLLAKSLDVCLDPMHRPEMAQAAAQDGVTIFSLRQALEVFETERQKAGQAGLADLGAVMACLTQPQVPVLSALASQFAVCDQWYSALPGPTWPNRFFLHAATSGGLDHSPSSWEAGISYLDGYSFQNGTIYDALDGAGLDWRVYHGDDLPQILALAGMGPITVLQHFHDLSDLAADVQDPGFAAAYVFIEPNYGHVLTDGGNFRIRARQSGLTIRVDDGISSVSGRRRSRR